MTNIVRGAVVLLLISLVTPTSGGPHGLSTRSVEGPSGPFAKQMNPSRMRAVPQTLPSGFLMPGDGSFQEQPINKIHPLYTPSLNATFGAPVYMQPSAGQSTMTGTGHKTYGLRQSSIDPTLQTPATISTGAAAAPMMAAPERSTRLRPGMDSQPPRASYGPQWLTVEVENLPAAPKSGLQPGLQK